MKKNIFILGLASMLFVNCSDNESDPVVADNTINQEILTNTSLNVITATYKELYDNSVLLTTACQNLSIGNEAELTTVKKRMGFNSCAMGKIRRISLWSS